MSEIVKPAISLCLQCDEWHDVCVKSNGWWKPKCRYWNPKKTTSECKYGPLSGCKYSLEYCLLDNRRSFKLCDGEMFLPLVRYLYENKDQLAIVVVSGNPKRYDSRIFIYRKGTGNYHRDDGFVSALELINDVLRDNGSNTLSHKRRYDRIQRTKGGGEWEFVRIEENVVRS